MNAPHQSGPQSPPPSTPNGAAQPGSYPPHQTNAAPRPRKGRTIAIGAMGLALVLLLVIVIVIVVRSGSGSTEETGTLDLGSAEFGDLVALGSESHDEAIESMATAQLSDGTPVAVTGGRDGAKVWDLRTGDLTSTYAVQTDGVSMKLDIIDIDGQTMVYTRDVDNWTQGLWYLDDPAQEIDTNGDSDIEIKWVGSWDGGVPVYIDQFGTVKQLSTGERLASVSDPYFGFWTVMDIAGERRAVGVPNPDGVNVTGERIVVSDLESGESITGTFDPISGNLARLTTGRIDGLALAATASYDGTIQAWNLETAQKYGAAAHETRQDEVLGIELVQLNDRIGVLARGAQGLSLFDIETGEQIGETFAQPDDGDLTTAAVAEIDGHPVAVTGTSEGRIAVWSLSH